MQVTLYQLLMEERYGQAIERGLLWYLSETSPEVVSRSPYEVPSRTFLMSCRSGSSAHCRQDSCCSLCEPCHAAVQRKRVKPFMRAGQLSGGPWGWRLWEARGCALQVAALIMQRNVLAARLGRGRSLPPLLRDPHACSRCFQLGSCALLHQVTSRPAAPRSGLQHPSLCAGGHRTLRNSPS